MPGYFRFLTLMAFHVFLQEKVCVAPSPKPCVPDLGEGNLSRLRAPMPCLLILCRWTWQWWK